jgi:hypothetical protein
MSDKPGADRWKDLGEPIHAFDSSNGVAGASSEDETPDDGESEIAAAIRRTGQANIAGLGGF